MPHNPNRQVSPAQLRVLLHYYYSADQWNEVNPSSSASAECHFFWRDKGFLALVDGQHILTMRGRNLVERWLAVELVPSQQGAPSIRLVPEAPEAVIDAMAHVRQFLPTVDRVVYNQEGKWEYSEGGEFDGHWPAGIDTNILQAGADALPGYPAIFMVAGDE